jgi:hypothetical protein
MKMLIDAFCKNWEPEAKHEIVLVTKSKTKTISGSGSGSGWQFLQNR